VPFYLRSGKRMKEDLSEIAIRFQRVPHCFFPQCQGLNDQPAELTIKIQPDPAVLLTFAAKEPGYKLNLRPVTLRFGYEEMFGRHVPEAYETLLRDVMLGDATLFMRADQVEAAWRLVGPVLSVWHSRSPDFPDYPAGSWGPEAAAELVRRDGRVWDYATPP
jgi:glucose-6-phosphate 1-dehydrogenase